MSSFKRENQFTDFARVRATGLRLDTLPDDFGTELLTDENSHLWVRLAGAQGPVTTCIPGTAYQGTAILQTGGISYDEAPLDVDDSDCNARYMDLVGRTQVNHELLHAGEDLINHVLAVVPEPLFSEQHALAESSLQGGAGNVVAKPNPGRVYQIYVCNESGSDLFFQLHNLSAAPGAGAIPYGAPWRVPNQGALWIDYGQFGRYFDTGITYASSSTFGTFTTANGLWVNLLYW